MCQKHSKPIIWREGSYKFAEIEQFQKANRVWRVADVYESQLKEFWEITYPGRKDAPEFAVEPKKGLNPLGSPDHFRAENDLGDWIYFPWSGVLTHMISRDKYESLRTNRNQNLITSTEQEKLRNFTVGAVGLSIGSSFALNLAYSGISNSIKLAEYDTLDTTNLNRILARVDQLTQPKIEITTQQIYEVNPYAEPFFFCAGLRDEKTLREFIGGEPKPKLIFEAIDNFEMKIRLRLAARATGIPVIMFSNLGDSVLIDLERYDLDKNTPLFNGRIGVLPEKILEEPDLTAADKNKYAIQLVGIENVPPRALDSVKEIGKTLVGRPQLMSTVAISGGVGAYFARQIALGLFVPSGRRLVKFNDAFHAS